MLAEIVLSIENPRILNLGQSENNFNWLLSQIWKYKNTQKQQLVIRQTLTNKKPWKKT
jgi:hypothetical protein